MFTPTFRGYLHSMTTLSAWQRRVMHRHHRQYPYMTRQEHCPLAAPYYLRRKKTGVIEKSALLFIRNLLFWVCAPRAQGSLTSLAYRRSSCTPPSPNLVLTHPIDMLQYFCACYNAISASRDDSVNSVSRATISG